MGSIRVTKFGGIRPAVTEKHLDGRYGTVAHNVRLRDLTLKPMREPLKLRTDTHPIKSIYRTADGENCCHRILTWDHCVSVVESPDPGDCHEFNQILVFHKGDLPVEPQRYFRCEDAYYPIKVPQPQKTLVARRLSTLGTIEGKKEGSGPDQRAYTYTWVDKFAVESIPAMPSATYRSYDDETWEVAGFDTPPPNAVCIRIYRAISVFEDGAQIANPMDTSFQLIEEVPLAGWAGVYVDGRRQIDLDYGTLTTFDNCDIPEKMEQVVATEQGYLVGFRGNQIFVSERYEPHNWPDKYRLTLPDKIVAIAAHYDFVYVGTTGRPYRVNISFVKAGDSADATTDALPYDEHFPCVGQHTFVSTDIGAAYCTHKGIVRLAPQGNAKLESRFRIDEDDFLLYAPNIAAYHNGKYIASRSPFGRGFIVDFEDRVEGDIDIGDLTTIDIRCDAIHSGRDGRIYFSVGNDLFLWNESQSPMEYQWRSKLFCQPALTAFAAAKVVGDFGAPVDFTLWGDGKVYYKKTVNNSQPFRLPLRGRAIDWQFEIAGKTRVREVHIGTSIIELSEEPR